MITTNQVKDPVHDQMTNVVAKRFNLLVCFPNHRLEGEDNVAKQKGRTRWRMRPGLPSPKCKHIGRSILTPISAIELHLPGVVGQCDPKFDPRWRCEPYCRTAVDQRDPGSVASKLCGVGASSFPTCTARYDIDSRYLVHSCSPVRPARSRAS